MSVAWSEEVALAAAVRTVIGRGWGEATDARLLRLGTNAVFRAGDHVIRVSPPGEDADLVQQQLDFAAWLVDADFATPRPLSRLERDEQTGLIVTLWEFIDGEAGNVADRYSLGRCLKEFHELTNTYPGRLPEWEPLGRLGERLNTVPCDDSFDDADRRLLCSKRDHLISSAAAAQFELPAGPLHGDVHTGNVLVRDGQIYLYDLDRIARGPREWDLTQPVGAADRFGGSVAMLDSLMRGYGWDLRAWPWSAELVALRLLFMTSWLLTLPRSVAVKREIRLRMAYWRDPTTGPRWGPV